MKEFSLMIIVLLTISCSNGKKNNDAPIIEYNPNVEATLTDAPTIDQNTDIEATLAVVLFNGIFVLSPAHHATVTLSIDGIVKHTSLLPGKRVQKGELLATLENLEFINLQQNYLEARAQCEFLEAEYRRQEILSQQEVASQRRYQESKAEYFSMKSRKDAAAAQLTMLGLSPQLVVENGITPLLEVRAPISGYISNLQMNTGKFLNAGEPLCEIIDKSAPMIRLTVFEKDLSLIKTGDEIQFTVNGMGNERFTGEIISIGQRVDEMNRSLDVYAKLLNNNPMFRPGMYVSAQLANM